MDTTVTAVLLGIVEGVTEFIPVSSTGHLILATELLGFDAEKWATFNVVIQLGAILAVVVQYWRTFWAVGWGMLRLEPISLRFLRNLLAAFLPSAVLGPVEWAAFRRFARIWASVATGAPFAYSPW